MKRAEAISLAQAELAGAFPCGHCTGTLAHMNDCKRLLARATGIQQAATGKKKHEGEAHRDRVPAASANA